MTAMQGASAQLSVGRRRMALAGMVLGMSVGALDQMILASAAAEISAELGGVAQIPWLFTAYLLTTACTMPVWGRLGDLYGRRRTFQVAIAVFVSASILAGTSTSMDTLVVARLFQGLGGGGLFSLPNAIVADLVEPRHRATYFALNTGVWAVAGLVGPILGGLFVDGPGWRWIFFVYIPVGLTAMLLIALGHRVPHRRVAHAIDYAGSLLLAGSAGTLILLCGGIGIGDRALSATAAGLALTSLLLGVGFVWRERRAREPLVPLDLITLPGVRAALGTSTVYGLANFATAIFVPLFAIAVMGTSATEAGLRLMPVPMGLMLGNLVAGRLIARTGRYRYLPPLGLAIHITGLLLFSGMGPDTSRTSFFVYAFITGLGSGGVSPVVLYAIQHSVAPERVGLATALPNFVRSVTQSLGVALLGTVMSLRLATHLERLAPGARARGLAPETLQARPEDIRALGEPLTGAVIEAFRLSLSDVFLVMALIMSVAFLVSLRMRD